MQYFVYVFECLLWGIFGLINFLIILKDVREKIIPNIYLIWLIWISIPLWFLGSEVFSIPLFILSLSLIFIISFILYYLWVWSPGDAKYLIVLALFIPHIGVVSFLSNIIIVTLLYLCSHFIFIFIAKWFFIKRDEEAFLHRVFNNVWEEKIIHMIAFIKHPNMLNIMKVINTLNTFLTIFVLIRLSRILIFDSIELYAGPDFQEKYKLYITLWVIISMLALILWTRIIWKKLVQYLSENKWYLPLNLNMLASNVLFILAWIFIYYDYMLSPHELIENMKKILTFYIAAYIVVKCLIYLYKFTFIEMEKRSITANELKTWDIIHGKFLTLTLVPLLSEMDQKKFSKDIKIIQNIKNKVDDEEVRSLKKVYSTFSEDSSISIIETFAFSPYIFLGFVMSILWEDTIMKYILDSIVNFL